MAARPVGEGEGIHDGLATLLAVEHPRRRRVLGDAVGHAVNDKLLVDFGLECHDTLLNNYASSSVTLDIGVNAQSWNFRLSATASKGTSILTGQRPPSSGNVAAQFKATANQ